MKGAALAPDGSVILAGYTMGIWEGTRNAGSTGSSTSSSSRTADFAAVRLAGDDGTELWRWQVKPETGFVGQSRRTRLICIDIAWEKPSHKPRICDGGSHPISERCDREVVDEQASEGGVAVAFV